MREGTSSEVKYTVQTGGRTSRVNYDDLKNNKRYYQRQTKNYNRQVRSQNVESARSGITAFIYIVLFVFFATTFATIPQPQNVNDIESSQAYITEIGPQVAISSLGAIQFVVDLVKPIVNGVQFLVTSFGELLSIVGRFIGFFYDPLSLPPANPTVICVAYSEVTLIQNINYTSNRWFYNIGNNPNIETNEEWHHYINTLRYGDSYTETCLNE